MVEYRKAMKNFAIDSFVPHCTADGRYENVQCSAGWYECWCVDATGAEIAGSRQRGWPTCSKYHFTDRFAPKFKRYILSTFYSEM